MNEQDCRKWMDREAPVLHPAFGEPPASSAEDASKPHHDIEIAIREYQKGKKKPKFSSSHLDPTWDEVLKVAREAHEKYESEHGKFKKARTFLRRREDWAAAIVVWLELLPQSNTLSVVRGGLARLFTAASKLSEGRVKILEAYEEGMNMIQGAFGKRGLYPWDSDLKKLAIELYKTILESMDQMISWFTDKPYIKYPKYLAKGPMADKKLDDLLMHARRLHGALQDKFSTLDGFLQRIAANDIHTVRSVTERLPAISRNTEDIKTSMQSANEDWDEEWRLFKYRDEKRSEEWKSFKDLYEGWKKRHDARVDSNMGLAKILTDLIQQAQWKQDNPKLDQPLLERVSKQFMSQENLFSTLCVDLDSLARDVQDILRRREELEESCGGQGVWLPQTHQFQQWFSSRRSEVLLVDGNADALDSELISPMSTFCATLITCITELMETPYVLLNFFCGVHSASNDPLVGPLGLMRSIIAQLLSNYTFRMDFIGSHEHRVDLEELNIASLCAAFKSLLYQVHAHTVVFCVIDGISLFERQDQEADLQIIATTLQELCSDPKLGCFFKLFMTSARQSRYVKGFFPAETHISVPPPDCCDARDMRIEDAIARGSPSSSTFSWGRSSCAEAPRCSEEDLEFEDLEEEEVEGDDSDD